MMNYIIVFFISMVPLIELRGSILYATGIGLPFFAGLYHSHYRQYAAGTFYLSVCEKDTGLGS